MRRQIAAYLVVAMVSAVLTTVFEPFKHMSVSAQPGCQTFKETGKNLCGRFLEYWQKNGGLAQQGFPISNEFVEKNDLDGKDYTVQYFERAVFEKHPENKAPFDVLLSQLGTFQFKRKYPAGEPGAPTPTPIPPPMKGVIVPVPGGRDLTMSLTSTSFGSCTLDGAPTNMLRWDISFRSNATIPQTLRVDANSIVAVDSTSKAYPYNPKLNCGFGAGLADQSYSTSGATIAPGFQGNFVVVLPVSNVPQTVSFFDLRFTVNGTPVTFRYETK